MADFVQAGTQSGAGPEFGSYKTSGGVDHPSSVAEYVSTLSSGNNVLQPVMLTAGLPVQPQTGSTWAITASALPLPAGAATAAKQPALGTAGAAATDVLTIQGITSMVALKVDGSGVTQPVSGTVSVGNFPSGFLAAQSGSWTVAISGSVAVTGTFWQATQPVSLASLPALAAGGNVIGAVTQSGTWNIGTVTAVTAITNALPAGTNAIGTVQPGNTANTTPWLVSDRPATSGGLTVFKRISTADVNSANAKNAAGQVFGIVASNTNASPRWLKLYDKATAPTVGTDTPKLTLLIPGNASGGGVSIQQNKGIAFASGIGIGLTTGVADADTGAVAANDIVVTLLYA